MVKIGQLYRANLSKQEKKTTQTTELQSIKIKHVLVPA